MKRINQLAIAIFSLLVAGSILAQTGTTPTQEDFALVQQAISFNNNPLPLAEAQEQIAILNKSDTVLQQLDELRESLVDQLRELAGHVGLEKDMQTFLDLSEQLTEKAAQLQNEMLTQACQEVKKDLAQIEQLVSRVAEKMRVKLETGEQKARKQTEKLEKQVTQLAQEIEEGLKPFAKQVGAIYGQLNEVAQQTQVRIIELLQE